MNKTFLPGDINPPTGSRSLDDVTSEEWDRCSKAAREGGLGVYSVKNDSNGGLAGQKKSAFDKQVGGNHYKGMAIQPLEFILKNELGFAEANAVKYICRHKAKGGIEDLNKAIHYLELAKEHYYG